MIHAQYVHDLGERAAALDDEQAEALLGWWAVCASPASPYGEAGRALFTELQFAATWARRFGLPLPTSVVDDVREALAALPLSLLDGLLTHGWAHIIHEHDEPHLPLDQTVAAMLLAQKDEHERLKRAARGGSEGGWGWQPDPEAWRVADDG